MQDVNKLLKMHQEMGRAMKQIKKMGGLKGLGALFGGGGMGAAMPGLAAWAAAGCPASAARRRRAAARSSEFVEEEVNFKHLNLER